MFLHGGLSPIGSGTRILLASTRRMPLMGSSITATTSERTPRDGPPCRPMSRAVALSCLRRIVRPSRPPRLVPAALVADAGATTPHPHAIRSLPDVPVSGVGPWASWCVGRTWPSPTDSNVRLIRHLLDGVPGFNQATTKVVAHPVWDDYRRLALASGFGDCSKSRRVVPRCRIESRLVGDLPSSQRRHDLIHHSPPRRHRAYRDRAPESNRGNRLTGWFPSRSCSSARTAPGRAPTPRPPSAPAPGTAAPAHEGATPCRCGPMTCTPPGRSTVDAPTP